VDLVLVWPYRIQHKRQKRTSNTSQQKTGVGKDDKPYSTYYDPNKEIAVPLIKPNKCKYFSKEMIKYISLQTALCPK